MYQSEWFHFNAVQPSFDNLGIERSTAAQELLSEVLLQDCLCQKKVFRYTETDSKHLTAFAVK